MRSLDPIFRSQHGLATRAQLLAAGCSPDQADRRVATGEWEVVRRGVYRSSTAPRTWRQQAMAEVLAAGFGAVVTGFGAAALWGLHGCREGGPVHVLRAPDRSRAALGARAHETLLLPAEHVRVVDGIPVTSIDRTIFDVCGVLGPRRYERAASFVVGSIRAGKTTLPRLQVVLAQTGRRGRRGTATLRAVLRQADDGQPVTASELEDMVLAVLDRAGLPRPRRQVTLGDDDVIGRVDFAYAGQALVVEADGRRFHADWLAAASDRRRDLRLAAAGWRVLRVTWDQLVHDPDLFVAALRTALAAAA